MMWAFGMGMWVGGCFGCSLGILAMAFVRGARPETDAEREAWWLAESIDRAYSRAFGGDE